MDKEYDVDYVILNNLGGITSLIQNLIVYSDSDSLSQHLILLNVQGDHKAPAFIDEKIAPLSVYFELYPKDNWYHVYKKLSNELNRKHGILISNDQYDLVMLRAFNVDRKVIQIVHDDYNLTLSLKFENCIDKFIAHSRYIFDRLLDAMPGRMKDIELIHYGIPLANLSIDKFNQTRSLNLLFLGRHDVKKGIYDIYEIDGLLQKKGIEVNWTILGKGPETEHVKRQWAGKRNAIFKLPAQHEDVMREIEKHDILVFPTKFEGFPVAVLESMSRGCVPIASDIPGGIQEVVLDGLTGYKCTLDANDEFALKIEALHKDRKQLQKMQEESIKLVTANFDVLKQTKQYQDYFRKVLNEEFKPRHHMVNEKIGSRLDRPWIPNIMTRVLRKVIK